MGMKKISVLLTQRGQPEKISSMLSDIFFNIYEPDSVEFLIAVDDDDQDILRVYKTIETSFSPLKVKFFIVKQSEHFTKDYWNFLAKQAEGRFLFSIACDNKFLTRHWDKIIYEKMDNASKKFGDNFICGLTKDNIKRHGEDPNYPNFSCHPVLSKEYVAKMGYFYDERYWTWGSDQAVAILYRELSKMINEWRLVSIMDVQIYDYNSMHTTDETDPVKLEAMRIADKGYQKNLRISQEHSCDLKKEDYQKEAQKIIDFIKQGRK